MKFVADGPDIPLDLIKQWQLGKVVFLAGAGISMPLPTGLPSFRSLALDVYQGLGDHLHATLDSCVKAKADDDIGALLDAAKLRPEVRVEANCFISREFDRLFSALETRLDQDASGRSISRRVREAAEARLRKNGGVSPGHCDLIRLSQTSSGTSCRIVTTNFDLLLEDAWKKELKGRGIGTDARIAPRPGAFDFEGVIHLHGLLDLDPKEPAGMILSSRDFARVYLRSGVIANYIYDLVRRYTVVLVGYSADDPTMRYLMDAISEDAALFEDMKLPYALAATGKIGTPQSEIDAATWRSKNIRPILYGERAGTGTVHNPLWETLSAWAEWKRHGLTWAVDRLKSEMAGAPGKATDFSRTFVRELLQLLTPDEQIDAVREIRATRPSFDWIEVIEAATSFGPRPDRSAA